MPGGQGGVDEAGDGEVDAGGAGQHGGAAQQRRPAVGLDEALEGGGLRREAVGLVVQAADADPGHG